MCMKLISAIQYELSVWMGNGHTENYLDLDCVKNKSKIWTNKKNKLNKDYLSLFIFIFKIIWISNIDFIKSSSCYKKSQPVLHTTFVINFIIKILILVNTHERDHSKSTFTQNCQFLIPSLPLIRFCLIWLTPSSHVFAYDKR